MGDDKSSESDTSIGDFGDQQTQIFDSQFFDSPTSSSGTKCNGDDADQLHTLQSTIPLDDTAMFEDELATQVMDLDGETQLVNLDGETQLVNCDEEIKVIDILDSAQNNDTQLFNDYDTEVVCTDGEETEKTEIVDDSDEFSDEDSSRRGCTNPEDLEHTQYMNLCKEDRKEYTSKTDCGRSEQHTSGAGFKAFTSIRAASLRAAGLVAHNKASQSKNQSCSILNTEPNKQIDGPETGTRCGFGRSAARKLFAEDTLSETKEENDNFNLSGAANLPKFSRLETDLAGLSYIDSQEPGDASQANALDFVDNFLKVNIEFNDEYDINKSTAGKSKPVLSAKGTRSLAKSANLINTERGIFDWDDNREDEGGGEFFRKKKEVFFASGPRKRKAGEPRDKKQSHIHEQVIGLVSSDSKVVLGNHKGNNKLEFIKDTKFRKNLIDELDNQSNLGFEDWTANMPAEDARFDTQMAAEAMEDLCAGVNGNGLDSSKADEGSNCMQKGFHEAHTVKSRKSLSLSNTGVRTRQSKLKNTDNQSKVPVKEPKRVKSAPKKNLKNAPSATSLRRRELHTSTDQNSAKKQCVQGQFGHFTPVACRTRQSMKDNESHKVKDASSDREEINILNGFYPKGKRTCQKLSSDQSISRLTRSKGAVLRNFLDVCKKRKTRSSVGANARVEPVASACTTPVNRGTPVKEASPICMGDEYLKQSCRKSRIRSALIEELGSLAPTGVAVMSPNKDSRKRRDVSLIRVVFSRHLDGDIIKHQKKILSRLGASESSSMSDATHFIADEFVRTRNMLEAIALGKPIVTHLWLESCGQACCHIDEKNFILRDAKKEKEFGFNLPASLACARQNPLLKGHRVLITPNTKPGKCILASLVKAVHGVAVERTGRTASKDDKFLDGLFILSCEEDYELCLPFLEKGAVIYSSELLLNGIVTQKLEFERHRLFLDHVKRTRLTIWVKQDDNRYKPVGKGK